MKRAAILASALAALTLTAAQASPELPRVMSLNVCTDQLVLLIAEPEQIVSLSQLSLDPNLSFLNEQAEPYPKNNGRAEEVFLAKPDLVVTGTFTLHNTTTLLERLNVPVAEFASDTTVDTVAGEVRRMGRLLGRSDRAEKIASDYEASLAEIRSRQCDRPATAIAYEQNGVVLGSGTLADSAMQAAGLRNLAAERGYSAMTPLPLEELVTAKPDIVILSEPMADAPALADQISDHPALSSFGTTLAGAYVPRGAWACGAPFVIEAVEALAEIRQSVAPCPDDPRP